MSPDHFAAPFAPVCVTADVKRREIVDPLGGMGIAPVRTERQLGGTELGNGMMYHSFAGAN